MTKIAIALATSLLGFNASHASADTVLGVFVGVQSWDMASSGSFGQVNSGGSSSADFTFADARQTSYYAALEHPIPLVPNIKIKHNQMETNGDTILNSTFTFGGENFSVTSPLATNVDLTNTDFILYYEVLDNDLVSIDLGINAKKVEGVLDVVNKADTTQNASESFSGVVPMLYGNVAVGLPFTGLGLFVEGSMLSVGDHSLYDYQVGVGYTFIDNLAVDLSVQLGYRAVKLEINDLDDINANLDFDGIFLGLEAHF